MKILFISGQRSKLKNAYNHRLQMLKSRLEKLEVETDILYLGNCLFKHPRIIQILNLPFLIKKIKQYDFIHAGGSSCAYFSIILKLLNKTKVIYDVHGDVINERLLYWSSILNFRRAFHYFQAVIMEIIALKFSDYFLVVSNPSREKLIGKGISKNKILLVRNGVDLNLFRPKLTYDCKEFTICYAGEMQKWQGIKNLIDAAERINVDEIKFKIIGFTIKDRKLKEKIKRILENRVELINRLPQEELIKTLLYADALIIPRLSHPAISVAFPTKFAEYLALGKPIIVSNVDETAKFVKKYNCGIVSKPDPDSICSAVVKLFRMGDEKREIMGANARRLAEEAFGWDIICRKYFAWLLNSKILEFENIKL